MPPSPKSGTSEVGQSLPKRHVRVRSVYPSISDVILPRRERREGPSSGKSNQPAHSPAHRCYLSGSGVPSGGVTRATLSVIETAV